MKSKIGMGIVGALAMTFAVSSTALADDGNQQRERHHQRGENRGNRDRPQGDRERPQGDRDWRGDHRKEGAHNPTSTAERMEEKVERMRRYEETMREQRRQQRADAEAWRARRDERARERRREIAREWGTVYQTPEGRAELALHADRMARLHRAQDVCQSKGDQGLLTKVNSLIDLEINRNAQALAALLRAVQ